MWTITLFDPLTANTYDISSRVLKIAANEKLDSESNTFNLTCKNIDLSHIFNIITIQKDGITKYTGFVLNQSDRHEQIKVTELSCVDWSYVFNIRIVADTYLVSDSFQGKPDLILKRMIQKAAPEFTTNNVKQCSTVIDRLQFQYTTLMEAAKSIMDYLPDWHWYVDHSKDVHLFYGFESVGMTFEKGNILAETLECSYEGENAANRIWIIGAKEASPNFIDQKFTADGTQRTFGPLWYVPNYTDIYLNEVLKTSKLKSNNDGHQDFLIDKSNRLILIPDNVAVPFTGTIRVHYRPTIQVIDYYENYKSIKSSGLLIERAIKNKDITDKLSARQYGKAEIKRKAMEKRTLSFSTREEVFIGQRCPVNIVITDSKKGNWNIVGEFLVKSVSTNITAVDELKSVTLEELI